MKKLTSIILSTVGTALLFTHAHSASFDCEKAATWVEKTVCKSSKLSNLDDAMAQKYKQSLADTSDKDYRDNLVIDQRLWLKFQRDTCKNIECLIREYEEYIGEKSIKGTAWSFSDELSHSDLPSENVFGNFSQTVGISTYNSDTISWDDPQDIMNTVSIYSVAKKPYLSVIEGNLIFTNFHSCVIGSSIATWSQNHWAISDDWQDENVELRLYPVIHKNETQLLLKDINNQFRSLRCGVRGYFDGIMLERE